jgi:hypothetical protein
MKTSLKRRVGLIGVTLALTALLLAVSVSATQAQGVGPLRGWGNCFSSPYGVTDTLSYGFTGTLPYGYGCGMMDGWNYGWPGYGFNPRANITGTFPYGYGMMGGWMMGRPGYGYNPQTNVPNSTPNGYHPQTNVPNTTPNGSNSNRGSWGHGMMGGSRNH